MSKQLSAYTAKDIEGYEGMYAITTCGKVYSHSRIDCNGRLYKGRWLKHRISSDGYHLVTLWNKGEGNTLRVHRLVALTFKPNPDNLPEVNHRKSKDDNGVDDIEWCTRQYNAEYSLAKNWHATSPEGETVVIHNLKKFCETMGLHYAGMHRMLSGKRPTYKGWSR